MLNSHQHNIKILLTRAPLFVQPNSFFSSELFPNSNFEFHILEHSKLNAEYLAEHVNKFEPDGLFFVGVKPFTIVNQSFFNSLSETAVNKLKVIANHGAGYDCIVVEECTKRNIYVSHLPDIVSPATADTAMWLILDTLRKFSTFQSWLKQGSWQVPPQSPSGTVIFGNDLQNKSLGLIGIGSIGKEVAKRAMAFGMQVAYHKKSPLTEEEIHKYPFLKHVKYVERLEDLLGQSDIISIHCPLTTQTRHLFNAQTLSHMKKGAILINTARGAIVDEQALIDALQQGHLGGVGLDVFEKEPSVPKDLLQLPNVVALPHIGTQTSETRACMERTCFENIADVLLKNKKKPRNTVPEQIHL